jgi:hypothetical protein
MQNTNEHYAPPLNGSVQKIHLLYQFYFAQLASHHSLF